MYIKGLKMSPIKNVFAVKYARKLVNSSQIKMYLK